MPSRISVCLEDLDPGPGEPRFVACVALAPGEPGLALDPRGRILWMDKARSAMEFLVAEGDQLTMRLVPGGAAATLERLGRVFQIPNPAQPYGTAGVLHGDVVGYGLKRYRVHVHGAAKEAQPPKPVEAAGGPPEAEPDFLDLIEFPPEPSLPDDMVGEGPPDEGWEPEIVLPEEDPEK